MKTINRIPKHISKFALFFLLLLTAVIFTTCIENEDDDKIYYYDVYGEGYVYYRDTNLPIEGLKITLEPDIVWGSPGTLGTPNPVETLYTDSNGYYRLHFIKKIYGKYPVRYAFSSFLSENMPKPSNDSCWTHSGGPDDYISLEMVDNAKQNIKFDTIKLFRKPLFDY